MGSLWKVVIALSMTLAFGLQCAEKALPEKMLSVMQEAKYKHSSWGIAVKDLTTGEILHDLQAEKMFLPASTTKLFSVAALLNAYGDDYRFKTPVYNTGTIDDGILNGNLILVGAGDLVLGGRQSEVDKISYTDRDHIIANSIPGVILTKEDPLQGLNYLAKQIREKGIREIHGDIIIDNRLFETVEKRGMMLSPLIVNENLIDFMISPTDIGSLATLTWRPVVKGYTITNNVTTVAPHDALDIKINYEEQGTTILVNGTIPASKNDVVRTFSIRNPQHFARLAFAQALRNVGIKIRFDETSKPIDYVSPKLPSQQYYDSTTPLATLVSPPLSEYAKLILKVSHNLGADLIPLLLAAKQGSHSFDSGIRALGKFVIDTVRISPDSFVFNDGAGGDENRATPMSEVVLLEYMSKLPEAQFNKFYDSLPILGVDGSLAGVAKQSEGAGKIHAKTGTGLSYSIATDQYFLTTQALSGYIKAKNGHLLAFAIMMNNKSISSINNVFPIFEDLGQMANAIYTGF